jgi:hypothetical protein
VVEPEEDGSHRITDMRIGSVDGRRLQADDLLLLERLGLQLPNGSATGLVPQPALASAVASASSNTGPDSVADAGVGGAVDPSGEAIASPPAAAATPTVAATPVNGSGAGTPGRVKSAGKTHAKAVAKAVAKAPAKSVAKGKNTPTVVTSQRNGRAYRKAVPVDELKKLITKHGGPGAVADVLGVPQHTVAGWLRRYRHQGHEFDVTATGAVTVAGGGGSTSAPPAAVFSGAGDR